MDHLKIKKAHLVGYWVGGIIALKFLAKHPDRAYSVLLGGMGWLRDGSVEQKIFAAGGKDGNPAGVCFRSLAKLSLSEDELKSIKVPVEVIFGTDDALRRGYLPPLQRARKDWPVVDIKDANHICIMRPQFREAIQKWLEKQKQDM